MSENSAEGSTQTIGKVAKPLDETSPAFADVYFLVVGDGLAEQRNQNAGSYVRETMRIKEQRDLKEPRAVPEDLAAPLFEAAIRDPREELQKLFAALTVNAIDPAFHDHVRPEFVETVKKWQPIDVRLMQFATNRKSPDNFTYEEVEAALVSERRNAIQVSVEHLKTLGCLSGMHGRYLAAPYGIEIMRAVSEQPEVG